MPLAVVLRPDDAVAARVVAMWECLFVAGIEPALFLPGSEPRMPLAVYPDDVPIARVDAALAHLRGTCAAMQVDITGIGVFGGLLPILSLTVAPTTGLLVLHWEVPTMVGRYAKCRILSTRVLDAEDRCQRTCNFSDRCYLAFVANAAATKRGRNRVASN